MARRNPPLTFLDLHNDNITLIARNASLGVKDM